MNERITRRQYAAGWLAILLLVTGPAVANLIADHVL